MPELPEVETISRGLAKRVTGDSIRSAWLGSKPEPLKSSAEEIETVVSGKRISQVRRVGKHIVFDLESAGKRRALRANLIVHLGMTGRMLVCNPQEETAKHTHAVFSLRSGREMRFVDPRRFGRLSVVTEFGAPGTEPLEIELEEFSGLFKNRKTPIKNALLNQKLLRGIGNIYADEALFRAHIRPRRRAASLTRKEFALLHASIQQVLREAIKLGGSTISDYVDHDGEEGFFQLQHRVYGRTGEKCVVCKTPLKRIVIGGRSSHYCPNCQK